LLAIGSFVFPKSAVIMLTVIMAYLALSLLVGLSIVLQTNRAGDFLVALLVPLMHISYGLGEWKELLFPGKDFSIK